MKKEIDKALREFGAAVQRTHARASLGQRDGKDAPKIRGNDQR
jgi:hypothetical protein